MQKINFTKSNFIQKLQFNTKSLTKYKINTTYKNE